MKNIKESFIHARNIEKILLDDLFSGEAFKKTENGFSNFFMIACLACNGADTYHLAELYSLAICDGSDCIQEVAFLANLEIVKGDRLTLEGEFQKMLALSTGAFDEAKD